ncbi:SDR family NAD(P)-dependent oxidoreductase [Streptomyces sp. NPDC049879]|uniref:SDR family NAD(P)-dependent oxidoreductase n=1 Tax=Streptomyces sp. NPDC049879 TaxID=3365598 RepID=UPI00379726C4
MAGRTVVISGGGTGIGLATAHAFAREGDTCVLVGRRAGALSRAAEAVDGAVACPADLGGPEGAARVAAFVADRFGAVDVLVHAAGGSGALEPGPGEGADALTRTAHAWTTAFRGNVLTAVLLTEALKDRLASPGGRLLFVSSIAAFRGSGSAAYAGAKAALHPYALALAAELGPRGVTVNVVAPGYVEDTEFFGESMPPERRAQRIGETLDGRAGHPGDVAQTLHWLASHAASHVTAQVIRVDGGAFPGR